MADHLTVSGLKARLAHAPDLVLIDVRTPAEYAEVHIPQAVSHPLQGFDPAALVAAGCVRRDQQVHVICRTQNRSKLAAEALEKAGFLDVVVVEGGTSEWEATGYPVVRGTGKAVISLERQVRIAAGALVLVGVLLAWLVSPAFIFLSGFIGAGLVFAGITDFCGLGLLIARAPWNTRPA